MNTLATFSLAATLALPSVSCAQDHKPARENRPVQDQRVAGGPQVHRTDDRQPGQDQNPAADNKAPRRLESITWNSVKHELTWVISKGQRQGSNYKATVSQDYAINMDDATMTFSGETRRFSKAEAANVHVLMNVLAKYAVDSTLWWDEGQGEPVNGQPRKDQPKEKDKGKAAVLHVSARTPAPGGASPAALEQHIEELQKKLDELRRLQFMLEKSDPLRVTRN